MQIIIHPVSIATELQGEQPSPRARMSVSLNETTNVAWFYGGRSEKQEQPSKYVGHHYHKEYSFVFIFNG